MHGAWAEHAQQGDTGERASELSEQEAFISMNKESLRDMVVSMNRRYFTIDHQNDNPYYEDPIKVSDFWDCTKFERTSMLVEQPVLCKRQKT